MSCDVDTARTNRNMDLVLIDPEMIVRLQNLADGRTDEALNARFGISYNTWRKLTAGRPVRASVASRLLARLSTLEASERTPCPDRH